MGGNQSVEKPNNGDQSILIVGELDPVKTILIKELQRRVMLQNTFRIVFIENWSPGR
jgi:hypothetical protein